jgi:hypothetical protein
MPSPASVPLVACIWRKIGATVKDRRLYVFRSRRPEHRESGLSRFAFSCSGESRSVEIVPVFFQAPELSMESCVSTVWDGQGRYLSTGFNRFLRENKEMMRLGFCGHDSGRSHT